ncbi:MAG: hypothetical protein U0228_21070 [Myxococcaceae bacterium]
MSHAEIKKPEDVEIPPSSFLAKLPMLGGILAVAGLGVTLGNAFGEHKARAMFSYLFAFEAVLAIALGALGWLLIDHTVRSGWAVVIRRFIENIAGTLPVFALLWIPIGLIGFHELYPWTHEVDDVLEKKRWFLTSGFWYGRAVIYLAIWSGLGWFLYSTSVKQDSLGDKPEERERLVHLIRKVCAGGIFMYGLSLSFGAVDWMMSLSPHWYSTIFGVYYFAASMLAFFAFVTLLSMMAQGSGVLKTAITTEHFHDMGKFVFGYTVFWAYIAFSQFILIWYANLPEETEYYMLRLEGGWDHISYALPLMHFFVPFLFLLSRQIKRNRGLLAVGAVWTLVMHCVDIYWLVLPNFVPHGEGHGGEHHPVLDPSYLDFTALIGVFGVFLAVLGVLMKRSKVIALNDPRLPESLAHENY